MPNSKQIVYLSQAQYAELIANGSITVDGVTVTYDENDIYVTPQAEPVTDVRVNGTSVAANGVANIPYATGSIPGVVAVGGNYGIKRWSATDPLIILQTASSAQIKAADWNYQPIVPSKQHESTFYGLAKVAGHDEASSTEPVGTYTPEAKGAIQSMLGVSDLIATAENDLVASQAYKVGDVFTANGKLYKVTSAIAADGAIVLQNEGEEVAGANAVETKVGEGFPHDVQVNGVSVVMDGVANIPMANSTLGVVNVPSDGAYGIGMNQASGILQTRLARDLKSGTEYYKPVVPYIQHQSVFYGLAKAAGADEKDSTLPVGQYTDTAKTAIRSMIGAASPNVIAVQDEAPTDTNTKIWLPETAETPVEVPTVAEMNAALATKMSAVFEGEGLVITSATGFAEGGTF